VWLQSFFIEGESRLKEVQTQSGIRTQQGGWLAKSKTNYRQRLYEKSRGLEIEENPIDVVYVCKRCPMTKTLGEEKSKLPCMLASVQNVSKCKRFSSQIYI
jgi:hypothetical protein